MTIRDIVVILILFEREWNPRHITHSTCIQIKPQNQTILKRKGFSRLKHSQSKKQKILQVVLLLHLNTFEIFCWATKIRTLKNPKITSKKEIMACAALSANSCTIASTSSGRLSFCTYQKDSKLRQKQSLIRFRIRAASTDDSDCNDEECAPDKEVNFPLA